MTKLELLNFGKETKEIEIEAWDNTKVTIKKLTIGEQAKVQAVLLKDRDLANAKEGQVSIDSYNKSVQLIVSLCLVEPKFTVKEIQDMSSDIAEGIMEINNKISEWSTPKK